MSKEYFEVLYDRYGCIFPLKASTVIPNYLNIILEEFKNNIIPNEPLVSCYIQRMLTELILISSETRNEDINKVSPVVKAITFIEDNYKNKITIEKLSSMVNLSTFYFSRMFKKKLVTLPMNI